MEKPSRSVVQLNLSEITKYRMPNWKTLFTASIMEGIMNIRTFFILANKQIIVAYFHKVTNSHDSDERTNLRK